MIMHWLSASLDNIKKKGHHRFCWEPGQSSSVGPNPQEPNEIDVLKQENGVLKQENSVLKQENGVLKQENGVLKPGGGLLVVRQGRLLGKDLDRMNSEQLHALQRQLHESLMCVKKREEQISMENLKQCRIQIEELERRFASTSTPEITCDAGPADKDLDANTFLGIQKMLARDLEPGQRSAVGPNPQMQEPNEIGVLKQEKGVLKQEIGDLNLGIRKLISYHWYILRPLELRTIAFVPKATTRMADEEKAIILVLAFAVQFQELLKQQQNEIIEEFRQGLPSTSTPEADKDSDANPLLGIKKMLARELEFGQSSAVGSNPQEPNEVGVLKREIGVLKQEIGGLNSGIRKLIWYHWYIDRLNLEQLLAFQKQVHESLMKRKELLKKQQNEIFRRKAKFKTLTCHS
ncbi:hypothetical protein PHJA_001385700 [Phtheirospermum japonicum]|uniref:Uncharacterized protein n=1 Tax=Phtheirospermum japonicum TaxID=374723 RepID=A0A830CB96_9LAMI|nr:hypothetical protein PHJA_001385700 [Phtheirospermum japonicum]